MVDLELDDKYIARVIGLVTESPMASDFDELLAAYGVLGFYEAQMLRMADGAEDQRKLQEAKVLLAKKAEDPKMTAASLDAHATVATFPARKAETRARGDWRSMSNLRESVEQCINGIKWASKNT